MNRRTVQRGLLAAVATLALFPTAAVAADGIPRTPVQSAPSLRASAPARYSVPPQSSTSSHRHTANPNGHSSRTAAVKGRLVTHRLPLNVRSGPGTNYRVIGKARHGSTVTLACKKRGINVLGNNRWYKLADHKGYVSAHYVRNRGTVPWC
ncbi:SH3 domain-containing protein [Streptomyces sp. NPDC056231]|uniref:SH3 domain-containing protein n=1 Tax=Streptomyces sp. NPDC056231 TaxID=3345755 RepID=UPI003AAC0AD5